MRVYFACSITGGRDDEVIYQTIVDSLLAEGHEVPTAHLASPEIMALEHNAVNEKIFTGSIEWMNDCDVLIAEVSTPSHGVGYEIAYGLSIGKPVLCCFREGGKVSKMVTGNTMPRLEVKAYTSPDEAKQMVYRFLREAAT
ncbi:MAG: nucleoside 2-deoxyribosyltransferase [Chloroflexota bacterium]